VAGVEDGRKAGAQLGIGDPLGGIAGIALLLIGLSGDAVIGRVEPPFLGLGEDLAELRDTGRHAVIVDPEQGRAWIGVEGRQSDLLVFFGAELLGAIGELVLDREENRVGAADEFVRCIRLRGLRGGRKQQR
jgi:hypothetical protein